MRSKTSKSGGPVSLLDRSSRFFSVTDLKLRMKSAEVTSPEAIHRSSQSSFCWRRCIIQVHLIVPKSLQWSTSFQDVKLEIYPIMILSHIHHKGFKLHIINNSPLASMIRPMLSEILNTLLSPIM